MKTPNLLPSFLVLVATLVFAAPLRAGDKPKFKELIDFTEQAVERDGVVMKPINKYGFIYGDWQGKVVYLQGRGLLVQQAAGQGGFGGDKNMKLTDFGSVALEIVIGNQNQASAIALLLIDSDGTEATWYLPLGGKPVGMPLVFKIDLSKVDKEEKPGKTPGLDKTKIKKWQIKGDWQASKAEVLVMKLFALE